GQKNCPTGRSKTKPEFFSSGASWWFSLLGGQSRFWCRRRGASEGGDGWAWECAQSSRQRFHGCCRSESLSQRYPGLRQDERDLSELFQSRHAGAHVHYRSQARRRREGRNH